MAPVFLAFYVPSGTLGTGLLALSLLMWLFIYFENKKLQGRLKALMRREAVYAQLLERFPGAYVRLKEGSGAESAAAADRGRVPGFLAAPAAQRGRPG
jgi:hypothetical protein